jgi:Dynamin family
MPEGSGRSPPSLLGVTTHGQPGVARTDNSGTATPAAEGSRTVATAAATSTAPAARIPAPRRHATLADELAVPQSIGDLAFALRRLRTAIADTAYPLVLPSAEPARRTGAAVLAQLDDYLLPRLARLDAPLLVVVGGSTGAGKSTLVNSLVRASVSPAGVLRPTTRAPILVSHPDDAAWFRQGRLLPELTRTSQAGDDPHTLRLVAAPALTQGLALLDAPDIDSVVSTNRTLAAQLLSAADLWLFVTSAARYADAVPWDLLQAAAYRGTVVALVLDRVPPDAAGEVVAHLTELLGAHEFRGVPLFVLPETALDGQGLLAEQVVTPIAQWLAGLAGDPAARSAVVRQTVDGALATIEPIVDGLAEAAEDQTSAILALTDRAGTAYRTARLKIESGLRDGAVLRGEVLARWREFIDAGDLTRALQARLGRPRDRVVAAVAGNPAPGRDLRAALESSLIALVRAAAADGAEQAYAAWQAHPSGAALLRPDLARPSGDLAQRAERLVHDWQRGVHDLVRAEALARTEAGHGEAGNGGTGHGGAAAREPAHAVNATRLLTMVGVLAPAAVARTGLAPDASRTARDDLLTRVDALLDAEAGRYLGLLPTIGLGLPPAQRLRELAEQVERARRRAALTAGAEPVELTLPASPQPSPDPEPTAQADPEPTAQADPEPTAQADPEPAAQADPDPTAQADPDPAAQADPDPQPQPDPDPAAQADPDPQPQPDPDPAAQADPDPQPQAEQGEVEG